MSRRTGVAAALVMLLALVVVPEAGATQRYAEPGGGGAEPCAQASPCTLSTAIEGAGEGDEVIIGAGTYALTAQLSPLASNVYVHGDFGGPMPVLKGAVTGFPLGVTTPGSRLSYVELDDVAPYVAGILCTRETSVDRVVSRVSGQQASALRLLQDCVVRDSLLIADGEEAVALRAWSLEEGRNGTVRNVTAVGRGPGAVGVATEPMLGTNEHTILSVGNSIADGTGADLKAGEWTVPPAKAGDIQVFNSNFDRALPGLSARILDLGGNQAGAPLFVNAAGGDYREAAGSPTIDAGVADQLGPLDLAGNPRAGGAGPDIGAYEFVPPPGLLESLSLSPKRFRAAKGGEATISRSGKKAPAGTTVSYSLSEPATVAFTVERALPGRKIGKSCKKPTKANRGHKKCTRWKLLKGGFFVAGAKGSNSFKFSGRLNGKPLRPGRYRLVGSAGGTIRRIGFTIVK